MTNVTIKQLSNQAIKQGCKTEAVSSVLLAWSQPGIAITVAGIGRRLSSATVWRHHHVISGLGQSWTSW